MIKERHKEKTTVPHPLWAETFADQIDELTIVVNKRLAQQAITDLRKELGLNDIDNQQISFVYHTKVLQEIAPLLPPEITLVSSAEKLITTTQETSHPLALHIGTANAIDLSRNFITTPTPERLKNILSHSDTSRITDIIFDNTAPYDYPPNQYLDDILTLIPHAQPILRIAGHAKQSKHNHKRHGHDRGFSMAEAEEILTKYPEGGMNMYLGNPLTDDMLIDIAQALHIPFGETTESQVFPKPFIPQKISIGGFGGYGEKAPDTFPSFLQAVRNSFPETNIILELGTALVERCAVLVCPQDMTKEEAAKIIPDANNNPNTLMTSRTQKGNVIILNRVAYPEQMPVIISENDC